MRSIAVLSFASVALAIQVNVVRRVDIFRRQYGTCQPPLSACAAGRDSIGPYAACAPVCCYYSSSYIGGCQADSYCLVKGASDYTCCANGVATSACTPATSCVNFGKSATGDASACPSNAPICTTDSKGAAGCINSGAATVTGAGVPATTTGSGAQSVLGEPNTDTSGSGSDSGFTDAGSSVDGPTGTGTGATATDATDVTNATATDTATSSGDTSLLGEPNTSSGSPSDASGISGLSVSPIPTLSGGAVGSASLLPADINGTNATFTNTNPPAATFTGAAALAGRIENAALGVAMLASLFAVMMG